MTLCIETFYLILSVLSDQTSFQILQETVQDYRYDKLDFKFLDRQVVVMSMVNRLLLCQWSTGCCYVNGQQVVVMSMVNRLLLCQWSTGCCYVNGQHVICYITGITVLNNQMFVLGGCMTQKTTNQCKILDLTSCTWHDIAPMKYGELRGFVTLFVSFRTCSTSISKDTCQFSFVLTKAYHSLDSSIWKARTWHVKWIC